MFKPYILHVPTSSGILKVSIHFRDKSLERLWINSGVRQWRGHGIATGALFGVPSDILIWPHFHSQATVPFVLAGVCWGVSVGRLRNDNTTATQRSEQKGRSQPRSQGI